MMALINFKKTTTTYYLIFVKENGIRFIKTVNNFHRTKKYHLVWKKYVLYRYFFNHKKLIWGYLILVWKVYIIVSLVYLYLKKKWHFALIPPVFLHELCVSAAVWCAQKSRLLDDHFHHHQQQPPMGLLSKFHFSLSLWMSWKSERGETQRWDA